MLLALSNTHMPILGHNSKRTSLDKQAFIIILIMRIKFLPDKTTEQKMRSAVFRKGCFCLTLFLFLIFTFISEASASVESKRKSLELYFDIASGVFNLKEIDLVVSLPPKPIYLKGGYKIELLSDEGKLLYQTCLRNPEIVFYDFLDANTSALSGGVILRPKERFKIRVPYLAAARYLSIYNPEGTQVLQEDLSRFTILTQSRSFFPLWEVDTLIYNGDPANRIDLVFLGDGYTLYDTATYSSNVQSFINFMFNTVSPFNEYITYFNIYKVNVISQESGSSHLEYDPPLYRNTALGTYYGCAEIDRLICADRESVLNAAQSVPWYDEIAVLVNDPVYGGSGGEYLISYNGYWGPYVYVHELGHSFGNLADEYLYGEYPGSVPNCNCDSNYLYPGWQVWIDIGSPGVGAFLGCSYNNLYRPTNNSCMMRSLMTNYCVVCREQTVKSIYESVRGYDTYSPSSNILNVNPSFPLHFELTPLLPQNHQLQAEWFLNGEFMGSGTTYDFISDSTGSFTVKGVVTDTTYMVLDDSMNLLKDSEEWLVNVSSFLCGDANDDSSLSVSDVIYLINYLFKGGSPPSPLFSADVNMDGDISISDAVYLINYLFKGGLEPCHM